MPLVYAAVVPHTPLLLPTIGKEKRDALAATLASYTLIKAHLIDHAVESVVILAPHARHPDESFQLQTSIEYRASFVEFGDLVTQKEYHPDHVLIDYLKHHFDEATTPWIYHTEEQIEYAAGVPFMCLDLDKTIPVVVIYPPVNLELAALYRSGVGLYDALASHPRRIAVLASGDLAHTLSDDAPGGFEKNAQAFDSRIISVFEKKKFDTLLTLSDTMIEEIKTCAMPSLAVLAGVLKHVTYQPHTLSYEAPFGVGNLIMEYIV